MTEIVKIFVKNLFKLIKILAYKLGCKGCRLKRCFEAGMKKERKKIFAELTKIN